MTKVLLPEGVTLAFCPTGEGGGVDPTCPSTGGGGTAARPPRVNQWPEADRRKLRALQSRLSRAVGEPAKAAVRIQIEALRVRVLAEHAASQARPKEEEYDADLERRIREEELAEEEGRLVTAPETTESQDAKGLAEKLELYEKPANFSTTATRAEAAIDKWKTSWGVTPERVKVLGSVLEKAFPGLKEGEYGEALVKAMGFDTVAMDAMDAVRKGAPKAPEFSISAIDGKEYGVPNLQRVNVTVRHAGVTLSRNIKYDTATNKATVYNALFTMPKNMQKSGIGVRVFNNQVDALSKSAVSEINVTAARKGGREPMVGYKVWPKFGYDGDLSYGDKTKAHGAKVYKAGYTRVDGRKISEMQATLETPAGQKWWASKGSTISLTFNLNAKTHASQEILARYRERKVAEMKSKLGKAA